MQDAKCKMQNKKEIASFTMTKKRIRNDMDTGTVPLRININTTNAGAR
jgi:hypothetical protein